MEFWSPWFWNIKNKCVNDRHHLVSWDHITYYFISSFTFETWQPNLFRECSRKGLLTGQSNRVGQNTGSRFVVFDLLQAFCWWQVLPMSLEKLRWPCFGVVLAGLFFGLSLSSWSHHRWFEITLFGVFVQVIPFTKCGLKKLVTDVESFARHLWHQVCCTWVGLRCIASSLSFQLARIRVFLSLLMCFFVFERFFLNWNCRMRCVLFFNDQQKSLVWQALND